LEDSGEHARNILNLIKSLHWFVFADAADDPIVEPVPPLPNNAVRLCRAGRPMRESYRSTLYPLEMLPTATVFDIVGLQVESLDLARFSRFRMARPMVNSVT
jgi:hypothetical protein